MKRTCTLALAVAIGTLAAGCGASPDAVCSHIEELAKKDLGEDAAKQAVDGCEFKWKMRKETKGIFKYKELADCVMDASSMEALSSCK